MRRSRTPAEAAEADGLDEERPELPPAPTAEESREQKAAYDASAQRLEDLVRAQNPAVGAQPPVSFEHLVQQFYVSAMIQMGAGARRASVRGWIFWARAPPSTCWACWLRRPAAT